MTKEPWLNNRVPYQLCDHIYKLYRFKNEIAKWPKCSSNVDGFCNGGELPRMVRVESITYFQNHQWYDELVNGKLNDATLAFNGKVEESWGNVTLSVMKFCTWLINSFGNFHELDYNVLIKLQECWWKIKADEVTPFTRSDSYDHGRDDPTLKPSVCKIKKFKIMKYSFNDEEEYITKKESEYLNHLKDSLDAYQEVLRLIDKGWVVTTPEDE
nr:hypothetical protein [Tanacetum cinerariifolium]